MAAVTMLDIARDLNVSVVTVSKVLRNQGRISAATRKRVLQRAKQLHYQMNWVARSLVTRRTFTIGLLLPEFTHSFFSEIARSVAQTVRPHGYHMIISGFEEDPELEVSEAESFLARQVDGLIIASAQPARCLDLFRRIQKRDVPYILIDRPVKGLKASFVGVENREIGRIATEHLIAKGCRRIGHLRGPKMGIADDRYEGYRRALLQAGLCVQARYVVSGGLGDEAGYDGMKQLLRVRPRVDGVFCFSDPVAIGAMKAIQDHGLNVPNDISVVGAGNVHYSDVLAIPLTTVDQGTAETGRCAAELLLEKIEAKGATKLRKILIEPRLIERDSTRRIIQPHKN
jgi:LacI family transcriptional regulator